MTGLLFTACTPDYGDWVPIAQHDELLKKNQSLSGENTTLKSEKIALRDELADQQSINKDLAVLVAEYRTSANPTSSQKKSEVKIASPAIMQVEFSFTGTVKDFEQIFSIKAPPTALKDQILNSKWGAAGTPVDMGEFGQKVVIARHALFGISKNEFDIEKFLAVSLIIGNDLRHVIPVTEIQEYPKLDLAVFDLPPTLSIKAPLIVVANPSSDLEIFHAYRSSFEFDDYNIQRVKITTATPSQISKLLEIDEKIADPLYDFFWVEGRIIPGDSGTPLLIKEDSEVKIIAFVVKGLTGTGISGGGIAARADQLIEALSNSDSN